MLTNSIGGVAFLTFKQITFEQRLEEKNEVIKYNITHRNIPTYFYSPTSPVCCCIVAFLCGLLFVQRSGNYFVTMFDDYSAGLPLTVVVILENMSVAWFYGTKRYNNCR